MSDAPGEPIDGGLNGGAFNHPHHDHQQHSPEYSKNAHPSHGGDDEWRRFLVGDILPRVPLFPLPGVVLLPGAILPLHVFEKRYRVMMADAMGLNSDEDGRGLICMCRIRPGHDPMDDQPALFPIACVGRIRHHERLSDGRCNLLLQGLARVRIGTECLLGDCHDDARPYRRADLTPLSCDRGYEIDFSEARQRMHSLCRRPPIVGTPVAAQLERLFASDCPTSRLADVLAFDLIEDADAKQRLLEEPCERHRVELLAQLLEAQFPDPDSPVAFARRFENGS